MATSKVGSRDRRRHTGGLLWQAAFAAYLQANPAARERVETTHLLAQLDDLRRRGILATA